MLLSLEMMFFCHLKKKNHISVILYKGGKSKDGAIILVQFFF